MSTLNKFIQWASLQVILETRHSLVCDPGYSHLLSPSPAIWSFVWIFCYSDHLLFLNLINKIMLGILMHLARFISFLFLDYRSVVVVINLEPGSAKISSRPWTFSKDSPNSKKYSNLHLITSESLDDIFDNTSLIERIRTIWITCHTICPHTCLGARTTIVGFDGYPRNSVNAHL